MSFFCMVNGTPRNVPIEQMKFTTPEKDGAPDPVAFRAAIAPRWRAAFDRAFADGGFVKVRGIGPAQARIHLRDARGHYLASIYCNRNKES